MMAKSPDELWGWRSSSISREGCQACQLWRWREAAGQQRQAAGQIWGSSSMCCQCMVQGASRKAL